MCDCRNEYCYCDEDPNRLQPHNGLQSCHSFELVTPTPKLNATKFQQKRDNRIRVKKSLRKKVSRSSSVVISNPQERSNGGKTPHFDKKNNHKKANGKSKHALNRIKSGSASDKINIETEEVKEPEAFKLSESGSEDEESDDDTHVRKEFFLSKNDRNETEVEMIQKMLDHTMRAYFMHSMEKIESLAAQLLRNECLSTKMYCELDEKISMLCQRSSAQFEMLFEKLSCLECAPSVSRPSSLRERREEFINNYESELKMNKSKSLDDEALNKTPRNSMHSTRTQSRSELERRSSLQKSRSLSRNEMDGRNSLPSSRSPSRNEIDEQTKELSRSQSRILNAWSNKSEDLLKAEEYLKTESFDKGSTNLLTAEKLENKCYSCHNKVQCLQKALDASIKELQESMKRLEELKCKKDAETSWHGSLRSLRSKQTSIGSDLPSISQNRALK